jgi:hypothetical protein
VAKVVGILKVAKFAGKVLGGVATAAGIYEGAKIVGNGVTAGLEAIRSRNAPPPPSPPAGSTPIAGADELWVAGSDLANAARSLVGAAQCPDEDVVSGPSYDCSESGREAHRQRILRHGFSPEYAEARVASYREYAGCEGAENRQVYQLAINQLASEGVPRREAFQAVLEAAVRMKLGTLPAEAEVPQQEATYAQPFAPAYQFGPAPVSFQFSAPAAAKPAPAKSAFGALANLPKVSSKAPQGTAPVKVGGADELWTGAGPTYVRPREVAPSEKQRKLEGELAVLENDLKKLEAELAAYRKYPTVPLETFKKGKGGGIVSETVYQRPVTPQQALLIPAQIIKREKVINAKKAEVETKKRLVEAEKAFLRAQSEAASAKATGKTALAASKAQEAAVAKQLADTAAELEKKKAELEAQQKQAASDAEKAKLEAKIAQLEAQSKNVAQLAAAPAQALQVAQQPSESGQIIGQLLSALLQKGVAPSEAAAKAADQLSEGETPAPEADSEPMDASDLDEFVSGYGYVYGHDEAHGGACCDACASGLACEGDSCSVNAVAGDEGGKAPWTMHWASSEAPSWALGIFAGGPGIPSVVSSDTCSTGSCRMPK